jgi:hypothetical protein
MNYFSIDIIEHLSCFTDVGANFHIIILILSL